MENNNNPLNDFKGREKELDFLEERYNAKGGQLIIVYGRRRVGKTETIRKFCKNKNSVFFTCTQTQDKNQLENFSQVLFQKDIPAKNYISKFENWGQAFLSVKEIPNEDNKKTILVIDEFPYMAKENPEIPSIIQKLWDSGLKNENLMIILCGSSMSYMEKEVLAEKNPLYGRATGIYKMLPMSYLDSGKFVPDYNAHDKIAVHSILGGIPFYLQQFDDKLSLKENILKTILNKGSILYSEPEFLIRQELREPTTYNTIIQAIAFGNTKFNEIHQSTLIEKGKLSVYLKNLIELGIIEREFPISSSRTTKINVQRGIYKLKDLFFRFWYAFVFPNLSILEFGDCKNVYKNLIKNSLDDFISLPFEDICIDWLKNKNSEEKLPFVFTKIGRWWDNDSEVDIIALSANGEKIITGECKFHKALCDERDLKKHIYKDLSELKLKNPEIFYYYFSWSGFTEEAIEFGDKNNVVLVTGRDLYK